MRESVLPLTARRIHSFEVFELEYVIKVGELA
jgi:hypothetical protein